MPDTHTISMEGSKYSWADADHRVNHLNKKTRSEYIQFLVERDIDRYNIKIGFTEVILIIILAMVSLLLTLVYMMR